MDRVMLSRQLADAAHYPAIDLTGSISRLMSNLMTPVQQEMANRLRRLWTLYQENKDLIQVGAYEVGSNSELDMAIRFCVLKLRHYCNRAVMLLSPCDKVSKC